MDWFIFLDHHLNIRLSSFPANFSFRFPSETHARGSFGILSSVFRIGRNDKELSNIVSFMFSVSNGQLRYNASQSQLPFSCYLSILYAITLHKSSSPVDFVECWCFTQCRSNLHNEPFCLKKKWYHWIVTTKLIMNVTFSENSFSCCCKYLH